MRSVLFCNELFGLGHLRISAALGGALAAHDENSTALIVTGLASHQPGQLQPRVDVVKLPCAPMSVDRRWGATAFAQAAQLALTPAEIGNLRGELSLALVKAIDPDVVVVDYVPFGRCGELRAALEWLRGHGRATTALGLRDFDDPADLDEVWSQQLAQSICRFYDLGLVYNDHEIDDIRLARLRTAGLPIRRTGLVSAPLPPVERPSLGRGYLLVTGGGGFDAFPLLDAVIAALATDPTPVPAMFVAGPMMPPGQLSRLRERAETIGARVDRERHDMESVLAGARAVIAMAGYCTVAEILGSGRPALLVPRATPRHEQLERARYWAATGHVQMLELAQLEPARLARAISELLERQPIPAEPLTGATRAAQILAGEVAQRDAADRTRAAGSAAG